MQVTCVRASKTTTTSGVCTQFTTIQQLLMNAGLPRCWPDCELCPGSTDSQWSQSYYWHLVAEIGNWTHKLLGSLKQGYTVGDTWPFCHFLHCLFSLLTQVSTHMFFCCCCFCVGCVCLLRVHTIAHYVVKVMRILMDLTFHRMTILSPWFSSKFQRAKVNLGDPLNVARKAKWTKHLRPSRGTGINKAPSRNLIQTYLIHTSSRSDCWFSQRTTHAASSTDTQEPRYSCVQQLLRAERWWKTKHKHTQSIQWRRNAMFIAVPLSICHE